MPIDNLLYIYFMCTIRANSDCRASVPDVKIMNNTSIQNDYFPLPDQRALFCFVMIPERVDTLQAQIVERAIIQFWTLLAKVHTVILPD